MGSLSDKNSTDIPLDSGETFTGIWEVCFQYASISISGSTDENSSLYVDFSSDTVNILKTVQLSSGSTSDLGENILSPIARYFRVRIINGLTAMTYLRVQTILTENEKTYTKSLDEELSVYDQAQLSQSVVVGKTSSGVYKQINVDTDGNLQVDLLSSTLATEATLQNLDGKVTACDTSSLATESTLSTLDGKITACNTTDLATESTLSTLDGKITACDTSSLATEVSLLSLDGKVSVCDTSDVNVTTSVLPIDASTETTLSALNTKIPTGLAVSNNHLLTSTAAYINSVSSTYFEGSIASNGYRILVDLSDTTNFPHLETGSLIVSSISYNVLFAGGSSDCYVKLGFVTRVDGTDGDVAWFDTQYFSTNTSDRSVSRFINYNDSTIKLASAKYITNRNTTNDIAIRTVSTLPSPAGAAVSVSGVGDLLMEVGYNTSMFDINVQVNYHSIA